MSNLRLKTEFFVVDFHSSRAKNARQKHKKHKKQKLAVKKRLGLELSEDKDFDGVLIGCLKQMMTINMMTEREKLFADGLIGFFNAKGYLSPSQHEKALKLVVRLITERSPQTTG